jgi:hypothetical protein
MSHCKGGKASKERGVSRLGVAHAGNLLSPAVPGAKKKREAYLAADFLSASERKLSPAIQA